ncbi:MAG: ABC transporter ATP-binding protein [Alphaproteobacteria bacterium]|nr:ABC transporter ATP-binding protein [Alphaproteobacteria bacterium]
MAAPLLSVRNLRTVFGTGGGGIVAVDDVSFDVAPREVVGIVGESGSGKSVTALSIMGLLPQPQGRIAAGAILFEGRDLLQMPPRERRALRGGAMGMVFQEPMTSLNPVFTIGDQIVETIRQHERMGTRAARARAVDMLGRVGIAAPARRLDDYPHQLSGGMRQRVMIAMALACSPRLLLADEPTTALDVTIQAQLLDLLRDLQAEFGMAIVLITHNMGVIAEFADRVLVMYAGRMAEEAPVGRIFDAPKHPYTIGLLASTPDIVEDNVRLRTIPGTLPNLADLPPGCRFAPRCTRAIEACGAGQPPMRDFAADHRAACIRADMDAAP